MRERGRRRRAGERSGHEALPGEARRDPGRRGRGDQRTERQGHDLRRRRAPRRAEHHQRHLLFQAQGGPCRRRVSSTRSIGSQAMLDEAMAGADAARRGSRATWRSTWRGWPRSERGEETRVRGPVRPARDRGADARAADGRLARGVPQDPRAVGRRPTTARRNGPERRARARAAREHLLARRPG